MNRQQKYESRNRNEKGLAKVCVWVPVKLVERLKQIASRMRLKQEEQ